MTTVLLVATLDTKGAETEWVANRIEALGVRVQVLDAGTRGTPSTRRIDITRDTVARAAGRELSELDRLERGDALEIMAHGVSAVILRLAADASIDAVLCIAGAGASLVSEAFEGLPLGFPKLILSPLASGARTFERYVGLRDVAVMHSVVDLMGVNAVTMPIYEEAAGYIAGAAQARRSSARAPESVAGRLVAVSMNGNTTPAVTESVTLLAEDGLDVVGFHANGTGGQAMESLIEAGMFVAVLDFTTTELGSHVLGGMMDAGPHRMEVAGRRGYPQLLVPGCIDLITVAATGQEHLAFPGHSLYRHNPQLTLVRLTEDEMAEMGRVFAAKANLAVGPTAVCVPTRGLSMPNQPGGAFWDPTADDAFVVALTNAIREDIRVDLVEAHINDDKFVVHSIGRLRQLLAEFSRNPSAYGPDSRLRAAN